MSTETQRKMDKRDSSETKREGNEDGEETTETYSPSVLAAPFFTEPGRLVQCCIVRETNNRLSPRYMLHFQCKNSSSNKVTLIAEKQKSTRTKSSSKYYIFDVSRGQNKILTKKSSNFLGKLCNDPKMSFVYSLYNSKRSAEQVAVFEYRSLSLASQLKDGQPPRKLTVILPLVDKVTGTSKSSKATWQHKLTSPQGNKDHAHDDLVVCTSKDPVFDGGQYRLNFGGRVTTPSVKNMQIVNAQLVIVAQFGRVGQDTFHLDYRYVIGFSKKYL